MYVVRRDRNRRNRQQIRGVIDLSSIFRFVQLIPKFGPKVDSFLSSSTSMEKAKAFWVNSFADKEIYQVVL